MTVPTLDDLPTMQRSAVVAKAFQALADPVRFRIVELLSEHGEQNVSQLVELLPVSQPRVSAHLAGLTECGFTEARREGRNAYYRLSSPWIAGLISLMRDHADKYCTDLLECAGCNPQRYPEPATALGAARDVAGSGQQ